ncbi:MAG: hypothetical protein ACLQMT_13465 [Candidatus Acidiferrales bacterium]
MKQLWELGYFLRSVRAKMRHGEFSRAPLRLLRLEWHGETAECDWVARPPDVWDATLPERVRDRAASSQALLDAMALREMLFGALPDVHCAELRAFRQSAREPPEPIIIGTVTREIPPMLRVTSPVMRAKLYGFHFLLDDGVLKPPQVGQSDLQLMMSA